jgi:hypothetical protein
MWNLRNWIWLRIESVDGPLWTWHWTLGFLKDREFFWLTNYPLFKNDPVLRSKLHSHNCPHYKVKLCRVNSIFRRVYLHRTRPTLLDHANGQRILWQYLRISKSREGMLDVGSLSQPEHGDYVLNLSVVQQQPFLLNSYRFHILAVLETVL